MALRVKLDFLTAGAAAPYDALEAEIRRFLMLAGHFLAKYFMTLTIRYGIDSRISVELEGDALVTHCDAPRGEPIRDVGEAVSAALAEPLDFPPLAQAALPGDKVVLALESGVPQAATIVAGTIGQLLEIGVEAADITLVLSQADAESAATNPLAELNDELRGSVTCQVHDPTNRESLGYLAAAEDGHAIYVNRAIYDADLVIPIGVLRLTDSLGYYGINSAWFPTFSDEACRQRFHSPKSARSARQDRLRQEADEVGWLLGLQFTIQVVPAASGQVLHVLAGSLASVFREGGRLVDAAWTHSVSGRAEIVVAGIQGDATQQTWENVGRALASAAHAVDDDGAVLICSQLAEPRGPALQRIAGADDLNAALHEITRNRPTDALAASELIRALRRGKVYLLSRLEDESVEELGILPIDERGVARAMARYGSCIVLSGAQYARAQPQHEPAEQSAAGGKTRS